MNYEVKERLCGVQGIFPTPFLTNGDVDYEGLAGNVEKDIAQGFRWLTCTGTGGEFYSLTLEEHKEVIRTVCQVAKEHKEVSVVPGVGAASLRVAVELIQTAEQEGADAVMVTPPYYLPCSLEGAKAYFKELAAYTSLPFMFYYYPSVHHCALSDHQLAELLLENDRFIAMKETSLDAVSFSAICKLVGHQINVITGASEYMVPDIALAGGKGFVWTWMHCMPQVGLKLWEATKAGDYERAAKMRDAILPFLLRLGSMGVGCTDTYKRLDMACGYAGGPARVPNMPKLKSQEQLVELLSIIDGIKANPLFAQ